uniref:Uncharacterized protein n=1 Tax=Solanum lycopersicum TaxID=4081 RepID=K4AUI6_SOLLC
MSVVVIAEGWGGAALVGAAAADFAGRNSIVGCCLHCGALVAAAWQSCKRECKKDGGEEEGKREKGTAAPGCCRCTRLTGAAGCRR